MSTENCADQYETLDEQRLKFLDDYLLQHCGMPLVQLHGFLTAISSLHFLVEPERWTADLGLLKGTQSNQEADNLLALIYAVHYELYADLGAEVFMPAILVNAYDEDASDETKKQILAPWAKGYSLALTMYAKEREALTINPDNNTYLFVIESLVVSDEELLKGLHVGSMDEVSDEVNALRLEALNLELLMNCAQMLCRDWFELSVQKTIKRIKAVGDKRQGSKYKNAPKRKRKLMRKADKATGNQ